MSVIPNVPSSISNIHFDKAKVASDHVEFVKDVVVGNGDAKKNSKPAWVLHDHPVENERPLRVIVIGAGFSGIYLGIRIPEKIKNCELVIYERNAALGGTWYENTYPGVACDIPSHAHQYSFNPKPDWSSLYAPGAEILEYLKQSSTKYGADRFMKFNHKVTDCKWEKDEGKWHVQVQGPEGIIRDTCDVLISARGILGEKKWPEVEGLKDFKGALFHSAGWDNKYKFDNKRVGIIGIGSSAIQILPKIQQIPGTKMSCFIRSRTWVSPPLGQKAQDDLGLSSEIIPEHLQEQFRNDPEAWMAFRYKIESEGHNMHAITMKDTPMQIGARQLFEQSMEQRLASEPQYWEWLKPNFSPACRRLTPGPGFLEALVEDNVEFVNTKIDRIDAGGVVTKDGKLHELDALICATGFHASTAPPFRTEGLNGTTLQEQWKDRPTNYLTVATDNFPNHFMMLGPNGGVGEGSLTLMMETTGDYIVKALRKIQKENIKSMQVKSARVRDFTELIDTYFHGTVFLDDCNSWYKQDGQGKQGKAITGVWPGSTLHYVEAIRSPRWEDFEYEYQEEPNGAGVNQLAWLGNGWTRAQVADPIVMDALSYYIRPEFQDPPLAGRPEDKESLQLRTWSH